MTNKKYLKYGFIAVGVVVLFFILRSCVFTPRIETGKETSQIRPEIMEWIEKNYSQEPRKKTAMTRLAEFNQYLLAHPGSGLDIERKESLAMSCYSIAFNASEYSVDGLPPYKALDARSFNTFARAREYAAYNGRLSGHIFGSTEIESWEIQCEKPLFP